MSAAYPDDREGEGGDRALRRIGILAKPPGGAAQIEDRPLGACLLRQDLAQLR